MAEIPYISDQACTVCYTIQLFLTNVVNDLRLEITNVLGVYFFLFLHSGIGGLTL